jgi:hypothetical protein
MVPSTCFISTDSKKIEDKTYKRNQITVVLLGAFDKTNVLVGINLSKYVKSMFNFALM